MLSVPKQSSKSSLFHFQVVRLAQILAHIIFSPTLFGILLRFYSEEDLHLQNNSEISILILASSNGPRNDYIFSIQVIYSIFPNLQPKGHKTFPDQIWTSIQALLPRHFDPNSLLQPLIISQKVYKPEITCCCYISILQSINSFSTQFRPYFYKMIQWWVSLLLALSLPSYRPWITPSIKGYRRFGVNPPSRISILLVLLW